MVGTPMRRQSDAVDRRGYITINIPIRIPLWMILPVYNFLQWIIDRIDERLDQQWERSPETQSAIREGLDDYKAGKITSLDDYRRLFA